MLSIGSEFHTIDWADVPEEAHAGESGTAYWRVQMFGEMRVRLVRYSAGYLADHWCKRGHVLHVLSGELRTELEDGREAVMKSGMTYVVGNDGPPHRSCTTLETTLFIVD